MRIQPSLNDAAVLKELGQRVAAARLARNLSQADLAARAGVSKRTLERLEAGEVATRLSSLVRVCRSLELLARLDLLLPDQAASPMAQIRSAPRRRQRATGSRAAAGHAKPWTWADR